MTDPIEQLRNSHRKGRSALSRADQAVNAERLCRTVSALPVYKQAARVAAYIAIRGEIDVGALIERAGNSKQFYLPVLDGESMFFAPWMPGQVLENKGFGLLEPVVPVAGRIDVRELDVVLTPLVVFDGHCNRIGQGGGYYDRAFTHKRQSPSAAPTLIGVAHESQREEQLTPQSWDVPLDMIVTDTRVYRRASPGANR